MSDWWAADPVASSPAAPGGRTRITVRPQDANPPPPQDGKGGDWWANDPEVGAKATAIDLAKSLGTGVLKGAIGLAGLPGDASALGAKGIDAATRFIMDKTGLGEPPAEPTKPSFFPGSGDIQQAVEGVTGELHKPETTAGRYAETIGSFAPAALAGPGGVARRLIAGAVIPGAASEAAGQATEGTDAEPYARAGAALAAGAGAILANPGRTTTAAIQAQLPDYVTPANVQRAQALVTHAGTRGVDLTWPEALSRVTGRPVLTDMQRILESAPQSRTRMQDFFADRPAQIEGAVRGELGAVAPAANPSTLGREVGQAAGAELRGVRQNINNVAEPYYQRGAAVRLGPQEMARVRALPGYEDAADEVRRNPQLARYVQGMPENSVGFLNEVKKLLDVRGRNAAGPMNVQRNQQVAAGFGRDANAVRQAAANASPDYQTALAIEAAGRQRFLQPLMDGPIGSLAKRDITTRKAIDVLFPANALPNSEHEITDAVSRLAARNPGAANQIVRAHIESVFNEATQNLQGGANQFGGAKFVARLVGNHQQRENLRAAVEALPNGAARWRGMQDVIEIAGATGTRQAKGSLTSFNTAELGMMGSGGHLAETVKTAASPGKWWSVVNDRWTKWQLGRNLDGLARIITDPASAPLFERLAGLPRNSNAAGAIVARLILQGDAATAKERTRRPN